MAKVVVVGLWLGENSAASVFVDGVLAGAAKQAWIDRVPASDAFPSGALDAALDVAGARPAEISTVFFAGLNGAERGAAGRIFGRVAAALRGANRHSSPGFRGVRVETASRPATVKTMEDLRRRCREARLPDVPLVEVKPGAMVDILNRAPPELRGAISGPGGTAVVCGLVGGGTLPAGTAHWGPSFGGQDAYRALSFALLERERVESPLATAERLVAEGTVVAIAGGPMCFDDADISTRCWMFQRNSGVERRPLIAPDGVIACTAGEAVRAFQARRGAPAALIVGPYLAK